MHGHPVPSPLEKIADPAADAQGIEIWFKRDDLLHPVYGGNKWRKLIYNLRQYEEGQYAEIVTYSGPFSNYLSAISGMCADLAIPCTAYIRGEISDHGNPVLNYAKQCGTRLTPMNRREFARRWHADHVRIVHHRHPKALVIPEGGSNSSALAGCMEIVNEVYAQLSTSPDLWIVAAGTGATAQGMADAIRHDERLVGVCAVKKDLITLKTRAAFTNSRSFELDDRFHFGGLAGWSELLLESMRDFEKQHNILLDPLYTGKAWFALQSMIRLGEVPSGSRIVFVHTGGMPGREAFNYRFGDLLSDGS